MLRRHRDRQPEVGDARRAQFRDGTERRAVVDATVARARVRSRRRARAAAEPQRFRVIDAAQPPAGVAAAVEAAITAYLRTLTDSDLA